MKILLITPPFVQLNCPYPATTQLTGAMRAHGYDCVQYDLSIESALGIFSERFLAGESGLDAVVRFLQGRDNTLATRITNGNLLPDSTVYSIEELDWAFGSSGTLDRAKHIATLYIKKLAAKIRDEITPHFDIIRYGEQIALAAAEFDEIIEAIKETNRITELIISLLRDKLHHEKPTIVGFTVPFPGCLISALQCAKYIKENHPDIRIVMGGGYVNTELRTISDKRIFDYIDYLCFDDGELPLLRIVQGGDLVRTMTREKMSFEPCFEKFEPVPDFTGIDPSRYLSFAELANPMHRLWSDGFWNKITAAHGCYWAKCLFCDTSLDYICRYEPQSAARIVDSMERVMAQTGSSGFHFTDEALPPKLLKEIALEIIKRNLTLSYWGNIRFEKGYTTELCELLAQSGMVAASGGLEVASPRILSLINKGVTIEQARTAARNFTAAGIMVHTYLMYGFPEQTLQETIDSLDVVRNMFAAGEVQSAFWHRFARTVHSPLGEGCAQSNPFANNAVHTQEEYEYDIEGVGIVLRTATHNFMHGLGTEKSAHKWFRGIC